VNNLESRLSDYIDDLNAGLEKSGEPTVIRNWKGSWQRSGRFAV
jgi:hypothetical protein